MTPQKPQTDVHVEDLPRKLTLYNYKCVAFAAVGSIIYGYCLSAVATTLVSIAFQPRPARANSYRVNQASTST